MTQEKILVYCYGIGKAAAIIPLFQVQNSPSSRMAACFERWQNIARKLEKELPPEFSLCTDSMPERINREQPYQKSIILLFTKMKHLADPQTYHKLPQSTIRKTANRQEWTAPEEYPISNFNFQPVITIGEKDVMGMYEEQEIVDQTMRHFPLPDPRFKFFDSSIWHRYVPMHLGNVVDAPSSDTVVFPPEFKVRLLRIIKLMGQYHDDNLYITNAARSALELQLRLLNESFIERFGQMGHYKAVTPFIFHSETQMEEKTAKLIQVFYRQFLHRMRRDIKIKWRFLMVDDYANSRISTFLNDKTLKCRWTKKALIGNLLSEFENGIDIDYPKAVHSKEPIEANEDHLPPEEVSAKVDIIATCLQYLSEQHYDILLLDFLLGRRGDTEHREFGHQFLQKLDEDAQGEGKYNRGPFGRFWVFPISSFPFAMPEKLKQSGLGNFNRWWHLANGCDPISTPQMFRYNLLSFLQNQITEVLLPEAELNNVIKKFSYTSKLGRPSSQPNGTTSNVNLWAKVVAAQLNEIVLKIELLKINRHNSQFAETLHQKLSSTYTSLLHQCHQLATTYTQGLHDETSFLSFLQLLNSAKKQFAKSRYHLVIESMTALFNQAGALVDYNNAIELINDEYTLRDGELDLTGLRLYVLPEELRRLNHIRKLILKSNHLQTFPEYLGKFDRLQYVDLSDNNLEDFPESLFALKSKLQVLNLQGNKFPTSICINAQGSEEVNKLFSKVEGLDVYKWLEAFDKHISNNDLLGATHHCLQSSLPSEDDKQVLTILLYKVSEVKKRIGLGTSGPKDLDAEKTKLMDVLLNIRNHMARQLLNH